MTAPAGFLGADPLAGPIPPMEAAPAPDEGVLDRGDHYAFQVKWDGVRMLAFVAGAGVRLQNRRLRERTAAYPELAALGRLVRGRTAILDGEVVVLHQGRPSFPRVLRREQAAGREAARLAAALPAVFVAFDLLYCDGEDLTGLPWRARQEHLAARARPGEVLHVTGNHDDGRALLAAVEREGLEGVVAKERASPYLPGRRGPWWLKVKVRRRLECVVGGYTVTAAAEPAALLLGLYRPWPGDLSPPATAAAPPPPGGGPARGAAAPDVPAPEAPGDLVYVGRVGSGLDEETRALLRKHFPALARPHPPFVNPPRLPGIACRWVEPVLTAVVAFSEWTEEGRLRAPSLLGFGRARPEECRL